MLPSFDVKDREIICFYQSYVLSFIDWGSNLLNQPLSGDITVLLSDGRLMCAIIVSIFPDIVPDINMSVINNRSSNGWNLYCILCDVLNICPEKRLNQMILNPNTLNRLIESLEDHFVTFLSYVSPNAFHIPEILYIRRLDQIRQLSPSGPSQSAAAPLPSSASSVSSLTPSLRADSPPPAAQLSPESHPFTSEEVSNQKDGQLAYLEQLERQKHPKEEEAPQGERQAREVEERVQREIASVNALHEKGHLSLTRRRVAADRDPRKKLSQMVASVGAKATAVVEAVAEAFVPRKG
ncbi:hypothetical protein WA588_003344 [Blastocystis sp. NMH]